MGRLGSESFPDFLRIHWNSRRSFVRQTELFKTIRGQVKTREDVFAMLREMEEDLDAYLGLTHPEASHWTPVIKSYVAALRMFSVRQPFPLLLAVRRAFAENDFETLLRACVMISFRYNVIGNQPASEQERVYNQIAAQLAQGELHSSAQVLVKLNSIYPDDEVFRSAFANKVIRTTQTRNRRIVRYILCQLEKQVTGQEQDFDSESFNLEHILPQHPEAGWEDFTEEEIEAMVFRLGNMTLMQTSANRNQGSEDYATKKSAYAMSGFAITRKIAEENTDWTPERIEARQNWMAKQATSIWRVAQLS